MTGQAKVQLILELKNRLNTGLSEAKKRLNGTVDGMKQKLNSLKLSHTKAFSAMTDQIPGLGNAMALMGNPYALAAAGAVALGATAVKAAQWSNNWAKGMAEVNVTAGLTKKELDGLSDKLIKIGERNATPLEEVPQAFNRIISSGIDVNTSLAILEPTLRAAKAGFADLEVVAAAAVGVMASSGEDVTRVYDILFATLNKGNVKFNDVAQYLPKIIPLAKAAGFALDETAGAWAYLTSQGQSAEQATTGVMNAVKAFSTKDIIKGMSGMGIDVFDAKGKTKPMVEIIDQLAAKMGKMSDQGKVDFLDAIGLRDMEAKGAILSMVQNVTKLKEVTDAVKNSQGAANKAYEDSLTPLENWIIISNTLKGEVLKPIGDFFLKIASKAGFYIMNIVNKFKELYSQSALVRDVISGIGTAISWAFKIATFPIRAVYNIFKDLVDLLQDSGVGSWFEKLYRSIRPYITWLSNVLGQVGDILYKFITFNPKGAYAAYKNFKYQSIDEIKNQQLKEYQELAKKGKDEKPNPMSAQPPTNPNGKGGGELGDGGISKITDSGQAPRNITINIDAFNKGGINTQNTNLQNMDARQIEAWMKDMFLRIIANVETGYQ